VFFIVAPIGNGTAAADEAKALESTLGQQYAETDQLTAQAPAADTSVYLYAVR
jgi:hypothetical protein